MNAPAPRTIALTDAVAGAAAGAGAPAAGAAGMPSALPWIVLAVLLGVLLLLAAYLLWRRRPKAPARPPASAIPELGAASFKAAIARLYPRGARSGRYDRPCVLVCGEGERAAVLAGAGMQRVDGNGEFHSGWWQGTHGAAFELPAEAWVADAPSWLDFLARIGQHRPHRALDALVWVIPLPSLARGEAELAADAARLSRKLLDLQTRLGLQVPLYVIVSDCHEVPGFGALACALPAPVQAQSLGWSNPAALGAAFQQGAAEQALGGLIERLRALVAEIGVDNAADDFGDVYRLPAQLAAALASLPELLHLALRRNATVRALDLRGIYLSGEARGAVRAAPIPDPFDAQPTAPVTAAPAVFCRDLFEHRIFAEFGLARQIGRRLTDLRGPGAVAMWSAVALALLWLAVLWPVGNALDRKARELESVLGEVQRSVQRHVTARSGAPHENYYVQDTGATLAAIERVPDWTLSFWAIPASWRWTAGLDDDLDTVLATYYEDIVLRDLTDAMRGKLQKLLEPVRPIEASAAGADVKIGTLPQFHAMRLFVDQTAEYEANHVRLERLALDDAGSWEDVAGLLDYLFQVRLSKEHTRRGQNRLDAVIRSAVLDDASAGIKRRDEPELQDRFAAKLRALHANWITQRFDKSIIHTLSPAIAAEVAALDDQRGPAPVDLGKLAGMIAHLQAVLKDLQLVWADGKLDLGKDYAAMQEKIGRSTLLGEALRGEMERATVEAEQGFRNAIEPPRDGQSAVLAYDSANRLTVAAADAELPAAWAQLQRFPFARAGGTSGPVHDGRTLIVWNASALEAARATGDDLAAYETKMLDKAPARYQDALRRHATSQAALALAAELSRAATPAPPDAGWRAANFELARQALPPLLAALRRLGHGERADQWHAVMDNQAALLLELLQADLHQRPLYLPDQAIVAAWNGSRNGALQAYGAYVAGDLPDYFIAQHDDIAVLAEAAKGPRAWLEQTAPARRPSGAALATWTRIGAELQRHAARDPGGSLLRLEQLITVDLNAIDSANCGEKLVRMQRSRTIDYFQRQGRHAVALFARRCAELQTDGARSAWNSIAVLFNDTLLGRYPFAASLDAPPAGPDQVRYLLQLLDTHQGALREWLRRRDAAGEAALRFLDSLEAARPILAAITQQDPVTRAPAALDLWPEFRINRARERGADQIIGWQVRTRQGPATPAAPAAPLSWRQGEPLDVSLTWALGSAFEPVSDPRCHAAVDAKAAPNSACWRYEGPWALLKMMAAHAAPLSELGTQEVLLPHALRFTVPVREKKTGRAAPEALVYARLGVSLHGKPERLALPSFPSTRAPAAPPAPAAPEAPAEVAGAATN